MTTLTRKNIYLLHMTLTDDLYNRIFHIIDILSNKIYVVSIKEIIHCTCNNNNCGHIYFVMSKIMQSNSKLKKKYTKKQLLNLFKHVPNDINTDLLYDDVTNYHIDENNLIKQKYDNICPICFENFDNIDNDVECADYCKYGCGKSIHVKCFQVWNKYNPYGHNKCLLCKVDWTKSVYIKDKINIPIVINYLNDVNNANNGNIEYSDNSDEESDTSNWYDEDNYSCDHNCDCESFSEDDNIIDQLNNLTIVQLRQLCRENGLSVSGNKEALVNRLNNSYLN